MRRSTPAAQKTAAGTPGLNGPRYVVEPGSNFVTSKQQEVSHASAVSAHRHRGRAWPSSSSSSSGTAQTPERFSAAAINVNRGAASHIDIIINRWSTDAERDRLMSVMLERGPDTLLDTLQDLPRVGYFRTPDSLQ